MFSERFQCIHFCSGFPTVAFSKRRHEYDTCKSHPLDMFSMNRLLGQSINDGLWCKRTHRHASPHPPPHLLSQQHTAAHSESFLHPWTQWRKPLSSAVFLSHSGAHKPHCPLFWSTPCRAEPVFGSLGVLLWEKEKAGTSSTLS